MRRAFFITLITLITLITFVVLVGLGAEAGGEEEPEPGPGYTANERDAAIERGFAYLEEELWKLTEGGSPRKAYAAAVTGWACLLVGDRSDGRRLRSRAGTLKRAIDYQKRYIAGVARLYDGRKRTPPRSGLAMRTSQYNWTLGMAALFLAECASRGVKKGDAKKALRSIVKILTASQQENGGWGHDDPEVTGLGGPAFPIPKPGGGTRTYPRTLLSATNCAASGLGAALRTLGSKEAPALEKAQEYYRTAQNGDGSFPYDPSQTMKAGRLPGSMGFSALSDARTAGVLYALGCLMTSESDPMFVRAARVVREHMDALSEGHGSATMALQFGALVSRAQGEEAWDSFRRLYLPRILKAREEDGSIPCVCRRSSPGVTCDTRPLPGMPRMPGMGGAWQNGQKVYVTAIHVLILLLDRTQPKASPKLPGVGGAVTPR